MMDRAAAMAMVTTILWIGGCHSNQAPIVDPTSNNGPAESRAITLYVPGMNERLKILGGDGPNKVKQALVELEGVESVEDEWEREMEAEEDLNLLFIRYDPREVTLDQLREAVAEFEFEAQVRQE